MSFFLLNGTHFNLVRIEVWYAMEFSLQWSLACNGVLYEMRKRFAPNGVWCAMGFSAWYGLVRNGGWLGQPMGNV